MEGDTWRCRCSSTHKDPKYFEATGYQLISEKVVSCGCQSKSTGSELFHETINGLYILGRTGRKDNAGNVYWLAKCLDCGGTREYKSNDINANRVKCKHCSDTTYTVAEEVRIPKIIAKKLREGAVKQITINGYEREPKARAQCLAFYKKKHGGRVICEICGFDFGLVYGEDFKDKIHVHHIVELSTIGEEYEVDPISDLIPVCPNCHLIIHSRKIAYTPEEVRELLRAAQQR